MQLTSAPEYLLVRVTKSSRHTFWATGMLLNWRENISRRVGASGRGTKMMRSRRPGRIRACWMEKKQRQSGLLSYFTNGHRDVYQAAAFTSKLIIIIITSLSHWDPAHTLYKITLGSQKYCQHTMALTFDLLPACLLRSRWRDWSVLYSCIDRPPFWREPWTKCLKCKLWNLSFPLLAVSMETMLMLSDKPSTSYRSHLRDPKTVLEYPKLPLSRLSDVIKWQAPLKHRQADRQTNMPCLH